MLLVRKKVWSHKDDTNILKFGKKKHILISLISYIFYDKLAKGAKTVPFMGLKSSQKDAGWGWWTQKTFSLCPSCISSKITEDM